MKNKFFFFFPDRAQATKIMTNLQAMNLKVARGPARETEDLNIELDEGESEEGEGVLSEDEEEENSKKSLKKKNSKKKKSQNDNSENFSRQIQISTVDAFQGAEKGKKKIKKFCL